MQTASVTSRRRQDNQRLTSSSPSSHSSQPSSCPLVVPNSSLIFSHSSTPLTCHSRLSIRRVMPLTTPSGWLTGSSSPVFQLRKVSWLSLWAGFLFITLSRVLSSCGCTTLSLWERGLYTNKSSSEWLLFGIILFLDTNNNFAHSLC